ncbi:MGMT family protein [Tomitella biformata]|uniref:MGMT family protein n=1 Tax=Tomitella biformata TaxID=630403 RepID=UPI0004634BAA|nr:MGMT family protein [Tomitella biformata]
MAKTTPEQVEHVRSMILSIPPGKVSTYGAIAEAAGLSTPRTVAWILRVDGGGLPWQRVIRADGKPAQEVGQRQLDLLADEGAPIRGDRVNMRIAFHEF